MKKKNTHTKLLIIWKKELVNNLILISFLSKISIKISILLYFIKFGCSLKQSLPNVGWENPTGRQYTRLECYKVVKN